MTALGNKSNIEAYTSLMNRFLLGEIKVQFTLEQLSRLLPTLLDDIPPESTVSDSLIGAVLKSIQGL